MRAWLFNLIADHLIALAMKKPYFHLHHADGSFYMERYWLVPYTYGAPGCWIAKWWREPSVWLLQKLGIAIRVHRIHTADLDRALHDHPWPWASIVLKGGYTEARPMMLSPCFPSREVLENDGVDDVPFYAENEEMSYLNHRGVGSLTLRWASDRHRIVSVAPGTVTLFITGPKVQWWGFYTPAGKVYYKDYESVHNKAPIQEAV